MAEKYTQEVEHTKTEKTKKKYNFQFKKNKWLTEQNECACFICYLYFIRCLCYFFYQIHCFGPLLFSFICLCDFFSYFRPFFMQKKEKGFFLNFAIFLRNKHYIFYFGWHVWWLVKEKIGCVFSPRFLLFLRTSLDD